MDPLEAALKSGPVMLYRSHWNALTGSPLATILLCQIVYWWRVSGRARFYKYTTPCASARPGDSWVEELGIKRDQFLRARSRIARRLPKGGDRRKLLESSLVVYWTDFQRRTWYELNEALLVGRLEELGAGDAATEGAVTEGAITAPLRGRRGEKRVLRKTEKPKGGKSRIGEKPDRQTRESGVTCSENNTRQELLDRKGSPAKDRSVSPEAERAAERPCGASRSASGVDGALAERIWDAALDELKLQMEAATFSRWLRATRALGLVDGVLRVAVRDETVKDWLDHRMRVTIERTLSHIVADVPVEFVVSDPLFTIRFP